jgi:pimeloyl-ACP methyl ester carboxylesterase
MRNNVSPLYFPSGERTLFGWLQRADGNAPSDLGVILCKPFGYEAVCSHEGLRAFAEACAAAGVHSLRFDYTGTGDSSDCPDVGDDIERWCEDISAAIDALQNIRGVHRICLVGIRLGALLAARVASGRQVAGLAAIAPVTNGRRYVRELLAFQAAAPLPGGGAQIAESGGTPAGPEVVGLDVAGFRLSAGAVNTLRKIDLANGPPLLASAALILDRFDLAEAKAWPAKLRESGVNVAYAALPGYLEMVTTPHAAVAPATMIEAFREWLVAQATTPAGTLPARPPRVAEARILLSSTSGVPLVETPTYIDDQGTLFAVVTEQAARNAEAETKSRGIILLNGGATNHIGPNRMYVDMGRDWAAQGFVVMRLDLAGLGDSESWPGEPRNLVYPPRAMDDIRLAIDFLRQQCGVGNVSLVGLCAGAYHAIRSAISGLPVDKVLMINPLTFYWNQGDTLSDLQIAEVMRNPGVYMENFWSARHWRKLLRGKVNLRRAAVIFLRRGWLAISSLMREVFRQWGIRLGDDLGLDLTSVAGRGIPMVFYFARGDTGLALLHNQGGSAVGKLGERCRVHVIDGADHIFSQPAPRAILAEMLTAELLR